MLVGGAGQIKITKDGRVLLHEMQIQHPTAVRYSLLSLSRSERTRHRSESLKNSV